MNQRSDIDRTLEIWMADGPTTISDRFVDVVSSRIGRTRQRRSWRLPWRLQMNAPMKLIVTAVAVIVLAVAGYNLLSRQPSVGGPGPSPTPTPTTTPAPTGPVALPEGTLTGGSYILQPLGDPSTMRIVADIPEGWNGVSGLITGPGPAGGILIAFMAPERLFSDPCHWDLNGSGLEQPGDVVVGPTVDDLVAALEAANSSYTASAASRVNLGQFAGQKLVLQLPGDDVLSTCDVHGAGSPFTGTAYYVFSGGFYAQGPNNRWTLYIVDVDGIRLITMISAEEGTPSADVTAAEAIVESFEITP